MFIVIKVLPKTVAKLSHHNQAISIEIVKDQYISRDKGLPRGKGNFT